jgi:hypothetical protein
MLSANEQKEREARNMGWGRGRVVRASNKHRREVVGKQIEKHNVIIAKYPISFIMVLSQVVYCPFNQDFPSD